MEGTTALEEHFYTEVDDKFWNAFDENPISKSHKGRGGCENASDLLGLKRR